MANSQLTRDRSERIVGPPSPQVPPLCLANLFLISCKLYKRKSKEHIGWGIVLRGITSELLCGKRFYACYVEEIHQGSEAQAKGFQKGDAILSIDGIQVKDLDHAAVVKMFRNNDCVSLIAFPAQFSKCAQVRVTKSSSFILPFIWGLMQLRNLEIINVKLAETDLCLTSLVSLRKLVLCHCSLATLSGIQEHGSPLKIQLYSIDVLRNLEHLSLAHNYLSQASFDDCAELELLQNLKKLDISRNLLSCLPDVVCSLNSLEILVIVDNNLTEIPNKLSDLPSLHTLCVDGNLLTDVDKVMRMLPSIKRLTVSNNSLQCEPEVIRNCQFSVASVEGNPYTKFKRERGRNEPSFQRTLSVRGQVLRKDSII